MFTAACSSLLGTATRAEPGLRVQPISTLPAELSGCRLNRHASRDWLLYNRRKLHACDSHYLRFRTEAEALAAKRARGDTRDEDHDASNDHTSDCAVIGNATFVETFIAYLHATALKILKSSALHSAGHV